MKMNFRQALIGGLVLATASAAPGVLAHDGHSEAAKAQHQAVTPEQHKTQSAFAELVRKSTQRFRNVEEAIAAGYVLRFGCVSGSDDEGAMGVHFVNFPLVMDGVLDPTQPELLIYEPQRNGSMRLIAVDYLVFAETWNAANESAPELMGQLFHLFDSPNRFALPAFYTLHVWAWKDNPSGTFSNWNPKVTCDYFNGESAS